MYKLINDREKVMMNRLQQIDDLKCDVNQDRFELVVFYREFTKCAYESSGGEASFLNNMLTTGQVVAEEQNDNAVEYLEDEDWRMGFHENYQKENSSS